MNNVTTSGDFRVTLLEKGVVKHTNGLPQLVISVQLDEIWDAETGEWMDYTEMEEGTTGYLFLLCKDKTPFFVTESVMKVFGWDGASYSQLGLTDHAGLKFQMRIDENDPEYADKNPYQVSRIAEYDATPGGALTALDEKGLAALDKEFGLTLKKAAKPKPATPEPTSPKGKLSPQERAKRNAEQSAKDDEAVAKRSEAAIAKTEATKPRTMPGVLGKKKKTECTAEEMWNAVCAAAEEKGTGEEDVNLNLSHAMEKVGGDEYDSDTFTNEQWGEVKELVLKSIVGI